MILQEQPLIGLLGMFLSINSYEIVSTFAAVKGELRPFVNKLIRYNETGKQINQNDGFSPYSKSLIFDLTFVILCSLVQDYGSEVSIVLIIW